MESQPLLSGQERAGADECERVPGEREGSVMVGQPVCVSLPHSASSPQIFVGKGEDREGFLKVSSGKKRGLVPTDSLEEI